MTDVFNALKSNNANVGGGYLVREGEARYIRGESQAHSVDDIAAIVIDERNGVPVTIGRRRQGPPRADDPRRAGHPRRRGGDRHSGS